MTSKGKVFVLGATHSFTVGLEDLLLGKGDRGLIDGGNMARPMVVDMSDHFSMVNLSFTVKPFTPAVVNVSMEWHSVRFEQTKVCLTESEGFVYAPVLSSVAERYNNLPAHRSLAENWETPTLCDEEHRHA